MPDYRELFHHCLYAADRGEGWLEPMRFTDARIEDYRINYPRAPYGRCTAGITLELTTDAPVISFEMEMTSMAGGAYSFSDVFDIWENGAYSETRFPALHTGRFFYEKKATGRAEIRIYFPIAASVKLRGFELGDWAPVRAPEKKLLVVGDSISQGLFGLHPSLAVVPRLAREFDLEYINCSIGGDQHRADLVPKDLPFEEPDLILTNLGTNDFFMQDDNRETITAGIDAFYATLTGRFPGVPVISLTPYWATDMLTGTPGRQEYTEWIYDYIRALAGRYPQVYPVSGLAAIPHRYVNFADNTHPSDEGFAALFETLKPVFEEMLK